jgi:hypothetical protein
MTVYIKVTARSEEGKPVVYEGEAVCFAVIGKHDHYINLILDAIGDAQPVTLEHKNMANNLMSVTLTDEMKQAFAHMWKVFPCFRTCLTSPEDILEHGRTLFDVSNYSLNEVMYCMFLMRIMVNDHCSYSNNEQVGIAHPIKVMDAFLSHGKPWWQAFLATIAPNLDRIGDNTYHMGGRDASVFKFNTINIANMKAVLEGRYEYEFCPYTYREVLDEGDGYTKNVLSMFYDPDGVYDEDDGMDDDEGEVDNNMAEVYAQLNLTLTGRTSETDLFGNPLSSGSRVTSVDELVEATSKYFDEVFGEVKCQ